MIIDNKFDLGQIVFLATDEDQRRRMVICIRVLLGGALLYTVACGTHTTEHYEEELAEESSVLAKS